MNKKEWLIAIINGAKGASRENGRGYIIFDGSGFVDEDGIPKQINNHNKDLFILKDGEVNENKD